MNIKNSELCKITNNLRLKYVSSIGIRFSTSAVVLKVVLNPLEPRNPSKSVESCYSVCFPWKIVIYKRRTNLSRHPPLRLTRSKLYTVP